MGAGSLQSPRLAQAARGPLELSDVKHPALARQHSEPYAPEPGRSRRLAPGIVQVRCNRAESGLQTKPEHYFCLNGVPL